MSQGSKKSLSGPFALLKDTLIEQQQQELQLNGSSEVGRGNLKLSGPGQCLSVPGDNEFNLVSLSSWKGFSQPK